jgi:hypothetical protein
LTLYKKKKGKKGRVKAKRNTFKAPPIFVAGVQNIQQLKELLVNMTGDDLELKVLNDNQAKIQTKSTEKYTTTIKALSEKHTEFHTRTYKPKKDGSFRKEIKI